MKLHVIALGMLVLAACGAYADERPTFEAVSIKVSPPPQGGFLAVRLTGGPGHGDPAQFTGMNVTLRDVLALAYNMKAYQISGPDWMASQRFDITAKIAPGTTEPQYREMLQNMLIDRFGLKLHHETKELPVMSLVVAKNGPKMTESKPDDAKPAGGPDGGAPANNGGPVRFSNTAGPSGSASKELENALRAAGGGNVNINNSGGGNRTMIVNGKATMSGGGQTMSAFADALTRQLGIPVFDKTGLTAKYDYKIEYAPDMSRMAGGLGSAVRMASGSGASASGGAPDEAGEPSGPTLENAIQQQLGLKLERGKGPVDCIVVDALNKTPTEN